MDTGSGEETENVTEDFANGIPEKVLGFFESAMSRRFLVGTGIGAATGALVLKPGDLFHEADAAPQDVHGSPNTVVKAFTNKKGRFRLCADGSIVDPKGKRLVLGDPSGWPLTAGYEPLPKVQGKPAGSPWVAVDVVQDANGTHVLFADGSVRSPGATEAAAPPIGQLQTYTFYRSGGSPHYGAGITGGGSSFQFETPFREAPKYMFIEATNDTIANYWCTNHPTSRLSTTKSGFTVTPAYHQLILFIGEVEVEDSE